MVDLFLNENFCLENPLARELFHNYSEELPIIDYHCHLDPKEIYENKPFKNITEAWLGGDHYKWRLMRANGVDEKYISGDGDDYQKFLSFATCLENAIGNPVYLWTHLEMKRIFNITTPLNKQSAPELWIKLNEKITQNEFLPREIIKHFRVKTLCTTDDPFSDLTYHKLLKSEEDAFSVLPTFRPDKLINLRAAEYHEYIEKMVEVTNQTIRSYHDLLTALEIQIDYFASLGCKISDHSILSLTPRRCDKNTLSTIFSKKMSYLEINEQEAEAFEYGLLKDLIEMYNKKSWTVQLHLSATRNNNEELLKKVGVDSGGDGIGEKQQIYGLTKLMNSLNNEDKLPRMILYSLNPNDLDKLIALVGCFQGKIKNKLQIGSAWWFNDTFTGMRKQLTAHAEGSLIGNFVGMLTDSRSFLSYPRHEYFRRILCQLLSEWVISGQYPYDLNSLEKIIKNISYFNAKDFFKFDSDYIAK